MLHSFLSQPLAPGVLLLIAVVVFLLLWIAHLEWRFSKIMRGKSAADLESVIRKLVADSEESTKFTAQLEKYLESLEKRVRRSLQGAEVIRFNPFKGDGGGNQSATTALLSEEGNGLLLTVLYSRDRVSAYVKPVERFASTLELTEEETEAIHLVRQKLDDSHK